ncbi:MAG TPA: hypothetical protein VKE40_22950 [Gemmataceae bacterium]|nr:hypothetical protein [Gemmataceae bacterium]
MSRLSAIWSKRTRTHDGRRRLAWPSVVALHSVLVTTLVATASHDAPVNPDDPAYLRRQYAWFRAQEPARQQQLRKLHEDFQALPQEDQARLTRVMQTYNAWLTRLPDADRERVTAASTAAARLEAVKDLREREWVEMLPKPYRDEYVKLDVDARRQKVQEWRAEEAERRDEWAIAQRTSGEFQPGKVPAIFTGDGRAQIDAFVANLKPNLSENERKALDEAQAAIDDGNYFWYAFEVARLSHLHPILPGKVGPKDWASLPIEDKNYLLQNDKHFAKRGWQELKELRRTQGRWPEFALELADYCQKNKFELPVPLGDCRKLQMPAEVREFLNKSLEPQLQRTESGRAELKALNDAEGKWPEYPRMIIDLARKHKLSVPGWTLPGPPQVWDRFRAGKKAR